MQRHIHYSRKHQREGKKGGRTPLVLIDIVLIIILLVVCYIFRGTIAYFLLGDYIKYYSIPDIKVSAYKAINLKKSVLDTGSPITENSDLKMLFFGDTCPIWPIEVLMGENPNFSPFDNVKPLFDQYDYIVGTLETTIDGDVVGSPNPGKPYTFSVSNKLLKVFREAGVDAFSGAGNHIKDYGAVSVVHTRELLNQEGIVLFGAGANQYEAASPYYFEMKGVKIALLSFNSAEWQFNHATAGDAGTASFVQYSSITEAKKNADLVIVMAHWGDEHTFVLSDIQNTWAPIFLNAGADIVIGGHPHVRQRSQIINGKHVFYSIGNFMFPGMGWDPEATKGELIGLTIRDKKIVDIKVHEIEFGADGIPHVVSE